MKGFSQEHVASRLEVTQNTYSKIERVETSLSVDKLAAICSILDVDFNTLFNFDENLIFNNCTQTGNVGNNNTLVLNTVDKLQEVYDKPILSKDQEIATLKEILNT